MQDIPFTQILVLLAFILFPLINWLLQRMQRRFESQSSEATCTSPDEENVIDGLERRTVFKLTVPGLS